MYPKRFPKGASSFQIPTLEEELQLIEGLNKSTGRVAGIYRFPACLQLNRLLLADARRHRSAHKIGKLRLRHRIH